MPLLNKYKNHVFKKSLLQDFPQKPMASSGRIPRESRRRHYYAREDSDEEEADREDT